MDDSSKDRGRNSRGGLGSDHHVWPTAWGSLLSTPFSFSTGDSVLIVSRVADTLEIIPSAAPAHVYSQIASGKERSEWHLLSVSAENDIGNLLFSLRSTNGGRSWEARALLDSVQSFAAHYPVLVDGQQHLWAVWSEGSPAGSVGKIRFAFFDPVISQWRVDQSVAVAGGVFGLDAAAFGPSGILAIVSLVDDGAPKVRAILRSALGVEQREITLGGSNAIHAPSVIAAPSGDVLVFLGIQRQSAMGAGAPLTVVHTLRSRCS